MPESLELQIFASEL